MAHDVFISHAHKDKKIADAICEKLESAGVRCWIAGRDISPGADWTEATRRAIESSRAMVLVFSENANTSPHIEREIAHAFYTKRELIPVRFTQALPRRDFLFYLGNVRWFDAFSPPPEKHLEALTTIISDLVNARRVTHNTIPPQNATITMAPSDLSDSWIGVLRASHYGTLRILKWVATAVSILAAVWMVWFIFWQTKPEVNDLRTLKSNPPDTLAALPKAAGDRSISKPTYTYTRFGLWVPPNTGSSPSVQPTIKSDFAKPRLSVATETPSERPRVDHTPPNPPNLIRTRRPTALPKSYLHAIDSNPGNSLVTSPVQPAIKSDFAKPRPSVAAETPSERPRVDQTPLNPPNLIRTRRPTVSSVQELPNTFSSAVSISRP